jgi:hypothetical protein
VTDPCSIETNWSCSSGNDDCDMKCGNRQILCQYGQCGCLIDGKVQGMCTEGYGTNYCDQCSDAFADGCCVP